MYLELAENNTARRAPAPESAYIRVPAQYSGQGKDIYVREDAFDALPPRQWSAVMDALEPYNTGMSGVFSNWKQNRQRKKDARNEKREARAEAIRTGGTFGNKLLNTAQNIAGAIFGGGAAAPTATPADVPASRPAQTGTNWTPWIIGSGILLAGGIAYAATRKKSRK